MKIIAVYSKVKLKNNVQELTEFRNKYDGSWDLHLTLKQPVYIEDTDVEQFKNIVDGISKNTSKFELEFDTIVGDEGIMMVMSDQDKTIMGLQEEVSLKLAEFNHLVDPTTKQYETNFRPHVTVATKINSQNINVAQGELQKLIPLKSIIDNVAVPMKSSLIAKDSAPEDEIVFNFK